MRDPETGAIALQSSGFPLLTELRESLLKLDQQSLVRQRKTVQTSCMPLTSADGQSCLAFASNDYLGLASDPRLAASVTESIDTWGIGAGASHLVSGHSAVHEQLELALAKFTGFESALYFSSGYMANIAVMPALLGRGDAVFSDRLNHASLIDGALLSRAELKRYPHGDVDALETMLAASNARRRLIVTDAVFSMDGDIAPLPRLLALAERYEAWLLVDDAHGFGVLGPQGRGSLAEAALQSPNLILMATLGKAAGVAGAFVAGPAILTEWLIQKARSYVFTTASPPMLASAIIASLRIIESSDQRRQHLQALIAHLRQRLHDFEDRLLPSRTPVQALIIGSNEAAVQLSSRLRDNGLWVPAIRPPTVPAGTARLRISLSASHEIEHIDRLCDVLVPELGALTP